ncbi:IS3 family transposase [Chloroflexota bacterium]
MVERITELVTRYGRYGYRRITVMLRREDWQVNHKKVERIWRQEGLKVPKKQPLKDSIIWSCQSTNIKIL